MVKKINVGTPINLENLFDTRLLIQAGSGGGKSYMLRKTVESVGDEVQQIILDPEGEFVTLREKFNFALVAKNGDIPLNLKYAETLAHRILETGISVIIDLYELKKHERVLFVQRFLDALINAPKELWHHCLVYVDEAHIFCPENAKSESAASVIDLCTRGRKRGFAAVLATQRLSKLNKDAAAECLNKMIGRTGLDIDRKRAGDELGMTSKEQMLGLRNLGVGEFYAFGPAISNEVIKFKTAKVVTTHLQAGKRVVKAPPTPGALKKILSKLKDIPEEAQKELKTKEEFQKRILSLERDLREAQKTHGQTTSVDTTGFKQEIQLLKEQIKSQTKDILDAGKQYDALVKKFQQQQKTLKELLQKALSSMDGMQAPEPRIEPAVRTAPILQPKRIKAETAPAKPAFSSKPAPTGDGRLQKAERAILEALAMFPGQWQPRNKTAFIAKLSPSGGHYKNMIGSLRGKGYIITNGDDMQITDAGIESLGDYQALPADPEELVNYWAEQLGKLPGSMLKILYQYHPEAITREKLASEAGVDAGGGHFKNCLGQIRTLQLLEDGKSEAGLTVKLVDELFS